MSDRVSLRTNTPRVLVCDDDPALLDLMARRLERLGLTTDRVFAGAGASKTSLAERLRSTRHRYLHARGRRAGTPVTDEGPRPALGSGDRDRYEVGHRLEHVQAYWRWWGQSKDPSKRAQLDEIRIGTSYLSVAP
jgi:hypothetical protein